jgi:hypothetical protein
MIDRRNARHGGFFEEREPCIVRTPARDGSAKVGEHGANRMRARAVPPGTTAQAARETKKRLHGKGPSREDDELSTLPFFRETFVVSDGFRRVVSALCVMKDQGKSGESSTVFRPCFARRDQ